MRPVSGKPEPRRGDRKAAHERHFEAGIGDELRRQRVEAAGHDLHARFGEKVAEFLRRRHGTVSRVVRYGAHWYSAARGSQTSRTDGLSVGRRNARGLDRDREDFVLLLEQRPRSDPWSCRRARCRDWSDRCAISGFLTNAVTSLPIASRSARRSGRRQKAVPGARLEAGHGFADSRNIGHHSKPLRRADRDQADLVVIDQRQQRRGIAEIQIGGAARADRKSPAARCAPEP